MCCFYDLSEVQVITFHANSKNLRNEVVPPSCEEEKVVVQLSLIVSSVCFFCKPCTCAPKPTILMQIAPDRFCVV